MSRRPFLIIILLLNCKLLTAQFNKMDSLAAAYKKNKQDSTLVKLLIEKAVHYRGINPDSGMICLMDGLTLARKSGYKYGETRALDIISLYYVDKGDLAESMKTAFLLLPKAQVINDQESIWGSYTVLGLDYYILQDYQKSFTLLRKSLNVAEQHRLYYFDGVSNYNLAYCYTLSGRLDSAEYFNRQYVKLSKYADKSDLLSISSGIELLKGNYAAAVRLSLACIKLLPLERNYNVLSRNYLVLAKAYQKLSKPDSALFFAKQSFEQATKAKRPTNIIQAAIFLTKSYEQRNDYKNAFYYDQMKQQAEDSLYNQRKALGIQAVAAEEDRRLRQAKAAEETYQYRVRLYALLGVLAVVIAIASILLQNNRQRKKANILLEKQKQEVQNTLNQLNATQTQLIQSEKMASLGELTAGIAHEIQNPLNFVNNFSDVNQEMLGELEEELNKGDIAEAKAIAADIRENEKKINHHGKRADFIVKGMLQHSRTSTGEKQLTNINVLADEFFKLSYHGLRAKDKSFNAELVIHFDENLPKVNIVQQDIGRVLLNLFNNAFYAVNQKAKTAGKGYIPTVELTTFAPPSGDWGVSVKDNGIGIPEAIKEKIMQPFFTTKPTGEGTGLGLSLSYDIIVKGHGGTLNIISTEGEGSEFIVKLPLN